MHARTNPPSVWKQPAWRILSFNSTNQHILSILKIGCQNHSWIHHVPKLHVSGMPTATVCCNIFFIVLIDHRISLVTPWTWVLGALIHVLATMSWTHDFSILANTDTHGVTMRAFLGHACVCPWMVLRFFNPYYTSWTTPERFFHEPKLATTKFATQSPKGKYVAHLKALNVRSCLHGGGTTLLSHTSNSYTEVLPGQFSYLARCAWRVTPAQCCFKKKNIGMQNAAAALCNAIGVNVVYGPVSMPWRTWWPGVRVVANIFTAAMQWFEHAL